MTLWRQEKNPYCTRSVAPDVVLSPASNRVSYSNEIPLDSCEDLIIDQIPPAVCKPHTIRGTYKLPLVASAQCHRETRRQSSAFVSTLTPTGRGSDSFERCAINNRWRCSTAPDIPTSVHKSTGNDSSILPSIERVSTSRHSKRGGHRHFHCLVTTTAHDFIRHEVYTIHLICVAR